MVTTPLSSVSSGAPVRSSSSTAPPPSSTGACDVQGRELSRRLADAISALVMTDTIDVDKQYELYDAWRSPPTNTSVAFPPGSSTLGIKGNSLARRPAPGRESRGGR